MKTTIKQAKAIIQDVAGVKPSSVKRWSNGFIFNVAGEWYMHQSKETRKAAMELEATGYKIAFPCFGAYWHFEV